MGSIDQLAAAFRHLTGKDTTQRPAAAACSSRCLVDGGSNASCLERIGASQSGEPCADNTHRQGGGKRLGVGDAEWKARDRPKGKGRTSRSGAEQKSAARNRRNSPSPHPSLFLQHSDGIHN